MLRHISSPLTKRFIGFTQITKNLPSLIITSQIRNVSHHPKKHRNRTKVKGAWYNYGLFTRHVVNKNLTLRYVKTIKVKYSMFVDDPRKNAGVISFADFAQAIQFSNKDCVIEVKVDRLDEPPMVYVEIEGGRKLDIPDASYLSADFIKFWIYYKKEKYKMERRILDSDLFPFDDEDDDDEYILALNL